MTFLSVIVPTRNEERHIESTLRQLVAQEYPVERFEIIVVDGISDDDTRRIVTSFIDNNAEVNIRIIDNPGLWSSRARNIGVRQSSGQLVAIIDGHVNIPSVQLFADMEDIHKNHRALCLSRPAPLVIPGAEKHCGFWIALARRTWLAHSQSSYIYRDEEGWIDPVSSGFAYDKSVFENLGYFDERFDAAEDVEFHYRIRMAGIASYTSPKLLIFSYPRPNLTALFRQMKRYGTGRARMVRKHPKSLTVETLVPTLVLLMFLFAPVAALFAVVQPPLAAIYVAIFTTYSATVIITGFLVALKQQDLMKGWLIAKAIGTTHLGLGWGFLTTIFRPNPFPDSIKSGAPPR